MRYRKRTRYSRGRKRITRRKRKTYKGSRTATFRQRIGTRL